MVVVVAEVAVVKMVLDENQEKEKVAA